MNFELSWWIETTSQYRVIDNGNFAIIHGVPMLVTNIISHATESTTGGSDVHPVISHVHPFIHRIYQLLKGIYAI